MFLFLIGRLCRSRNRVRKCFPQRLRIGSFSEFVTKLAVRHDSRNERQRVEMFCCSTCRTKQEEEVLSRRAVRRSQIDSVFQTDKNNLRLSQRIQIAVRNGDRIPNRRRDNPLSLKKNLDDFFAFIAGPEPIIRSMTCGMRSSIPLADRSSRQVSLLENVRSRYFTAVSHLAEATSRSMTQLRLTGVPPNEFFCSLAA